MLDFKLTQPQQEAQPSKTERDDQVHDLIILGGGPAGLTAAIYAGRAALKTLVLAGSLVGGQVSNTGKIENFPGFPDGVDGPDLAQRMHEQAGDETCLGLSRKARISHKSRRNRQSCWATTSPRR